MALRQQGRPGPSGPAGPQGIPGIGSNSNLFASPGDYGLISDGRSHPLSDGYSTLAAAKIVYPFATSLTQEVDYCACKAASNACFGADLEIVTSYLVIGQSHSGNTIQIVPSPNWTVNQWAGYTFFRKFHSNGFVDQQVVLSNTADTVTLVTSLPFGAGAADNEYAFGFGEHGSAGVTLNKQLYLPGGNYWFGDDTWLIRNLASGVISGAGEIATMLRGNVTPFRTDGCWYTTFRDFGVALARDDATVAFDLDGNVESGGYATRGVQGVTLINILVDGGGSTYGFAICRQGGNGAQGSEIKIINPHFKSASFACVYINGFNALAVSFDGGDIQSYPKHGIFAVGGTPHVYGTSFESTYGWRQVENGGADIRVGDAGAYEFSVIKGCRTESPIFLHNAGAVKTEVTCIAGNLAMPGWFASTSYGANANHYKAIQYGGRFFVATTEGTSGSSLPGFDLVAAGGTVADGSIVWTETYVDFIYVVDNGGKLDYQTIRCDAGGVTGPEGTLPLITNVDAVMTTSQRIAFVDATDGNRTILLPNVTRGIPVTVKKTDTSANTVTVLSPTAKFEGSASTYVIAGGSRGKAEFMLMDTTPGGTLFWQVIG